MGRDFPRGVLVHRDEKSIGFFANGFPRYDEVDRSSPRWRRGRPYGAAVEVHDFPAYGEAEARAAGAGIGLAALGELIEDRFQLTLRDSDAVVRNGAMERWATLGQVAVRYCDLDRALFRGKFDRVR